MKPRSIKTHINIMVSLCALIFASVCLHFYVDHVIDRAELKLKEITDIEKRISLLVLAEEKAIQTPQGKVPSESAYTELAGAIDGYLDALDPALVLTRRELFDRYFTIRTNYRRLLADVHARLLRLVDSVAYIHQHHIAYMKNFVDSGVQPHAFDPDEPDVFATPDRAAADEIDIVTVAVQVQTSLFELMKSFNDLQIGRKPADIRMEFDARIKQFFDRAKTFESLSLDAQDGILVEELLLEGRNLERSFNDFLTVSRTETSLSLQLEDNKESLITSLIALSSRLENNNAGLREKNGWFRTVVLIIGIGLVAVIFIDGGRIINEIRRTVHEAGRIQEDLSYRVAYTTDTFHEFQVVFEALNTMAETIRSNVNALEASRDRLEQSVQERTRDLFLANRDLRNEIQERRRAEKDLKDSRERLALALDISGAVVWEWDASTDHLTMDETMARGLGIWIDGDGRNVASIGKVLPPEEFDEFRQTMIALMKNQLPLYAREHRIKTSDGSRRVFKVYGKVVKRSAGGRAEILLGTAIDITAQKEAEQRTLALEKRLQQSEKMEAIGNLAGGIAHDFNNILGGILGYAQLAQRNLADSGKVTGYLDQVVSASNRARELITQILAFSRKAKAEKQPCRIQHVVREALHLLRASIPKSVVIQEAIDIEETTVMANQTQIHQVVMNLCTNAYQAIEPTGGCLEVSLERVRAENLLPDREVIGTAGAVRLRVADDGCGMDSETLSRIFEPYFSTKKIGQGTGMGLATVHGIVTDHGGSIDVRSNPGQGTTIDVYLPVISRGIETRPAQADAIPFGNERILAVDDESILADVIRMSLGDLGYEVVAMTDPIAAFERFRSDPEAFDMAILDFIMPGMKGDRLAREMTAIRKDFPVVLCTGLKDSLTRDETRACGIRAIFTKPVDINDLAKNVRQMLDSQPA